MPNKMRSPALAVPAQMVTPICPLIREDLSGKVVLVVGANTGLGFEAAKHFARMNPAKLILTVRDRAKGEVTVSRIAEATKYRAEYALVDLGDFSSVKSFLDEFERNNTRLDIALLNAGVSLTAYSQTKDGWETTIQVNHLSTSWIALRLVPLLKATGKEFNTTPRVVLLTSSLHYFANVFDRPEFLAQPDTFLKQLSDREYCTATRMESRYAESKLLVLLFTRAMAERLPLEGTNIVVNCVCPGLCSSELVRDISGVKKVAFKVLMFALANTTEQGGRQLVNAALGSQGQETKAHGSFNQNSRINEPAPFVSSKVGKEFQDRLWVQTLDILAAQDTKLVELVESGVVSAK